jgi:hypothetical protein
LAFDSNIGQKIFSSDNLTETFKLIFTAMTSDDSQLRNIFLDLAEILFGKSRVKQSLEEFGQEVWEEAAGFPWCASDNPQVSTLHYDL